MPYRPHRRLRRTRAVTLIGLPIMAMLTGCAGTTHIGTILDDPSAFDGRQVRIEGDVGAPVGVPFVGGAYQVSDGTGTLTVVSDDGGVPREGADVRVVGVFRAIFTLGTRTLAVLEERERQVR